MLCPLFISAIDECSQ